MFSTEAYSCICEFPYTFGCFIYYHEAGFIINKQQQQKFTTDTYTGAVVFFKFEFFITGKILQITYLTFSISYFELKSNILLFN